MELVIVNGEREERLELQPAETGYGVVVGERRYQVDVAASGDVYSLLVEGHQAELVVRRGADGLYSIQDAESEHQLRVLDPLQHLAASGGGGRRAGGAQRIAAYMPGRVVSILVTEGQRVEAGQGILVLEAMKMENEIRAESSGVVRSLLVEPGQAVEGGDPLFEIE